MKAIAKLSSEDRRAAIIKAVLFGYGEVPTTFLPKMFLADTENKPYPYDLAKAKQLIAASSRMDAGRALRARSRRREDRIDDVTVPRVGSGLRRPEGPIWTERTYQGGGRELP